jgi:hypothetical protein
MDERDIALSALRAAGHDQAAALVEAIIPGAAAAPAAAPAAAVPVAVPVEPTPPAGNGQLQTLDEWEALPQDERIARMDEADALILRGER